MVTEVIMPKLGQTMTEGTVVEWLKQEGDEVKRGEVLFTVESDKATLEVEAIKRGYLRKCLVPAGGEAPVLTPVALLTATPDEDISEYVAGSNQHLHTSAGENAPLPESQEHGSSAGGSVSRESGGGRIFVSPRARRVAREKDVELSRVGGTGPDGRIVERDILAFVESRPKVSPVALRLAESLGVDIGTVEGTGPSRRVLRQDVEKAAAAVAPEAAGEVERVSAQTGEGRPVSETPITGVRAVIARRMYESHQATAAVTLTMEVDATALVEVREGLKKTLAKDLGFNIGYNDLLIKIAARALHDFPYVNVRLVGDAATGVIQQLPQVNVALAVDTERGLLVPVVRDADRKGVVEIAEDLRALIGRVRDGTAGPDDLSGSTFTITNLGMFEVDAFTPIINMPETAILGVGGIKACPVVIGDNICVRKMMWLSLTFDHRLVDGAPAARFLQRIKSLIEEPLLLLA